MDELISKQKIIKKLDMALEFITRDVSKESDAYHIVYGTVDITKCMIMTIQPKRGKWIEIEAFSDCRYVKCDQCKTVEVFYYGKRNTNFCPNCGADMREVTT